MTRTSNKATGSDVAFHDVNYSPPGGPVSPSIRGNVGRDGKVLRVPTSDGAKRGPRTAQIVLARGVCGKIASRAVALVPQAAPASG